MIGLLKAYPTIRIYSAGIEVIGVSEKIVVNNLVKVFGNKPPHIALKKLEEGWNKNEILEKTGQTIGIKKRILFCQ